MFHERVDCRFRRSCELATSSSLHADVRVSVGSASHLLDPSDQSALHMIVRLEGSAKFRMGLHVENRRVGLG